MPDEKHPDLGVRPYWSPDSANPAQCEHRTCTVRPQGTVVDERGGPVGRYCNKHGHEEVGKRRAAIAKAERAAR